MPTIQQCMNLAPAGTGTSTLRDTLFQYSNYTHHEHKWKIRNALRKHPELKCFIMTVREPASRLSSLLRYRAMNSNDNQSILSAMPGDDIAHALANASDPLHARVAEYVPKMVWETQVSYLSGNTCAIGDMAVFFVCNELETEDLNSLLTGTFGVNHTTVVEKARRSKSPKVASA